MDSEQTLVPFWIEYTGVIPAKTGIQSIYRVRRTHFHLDPAAPTPRVKQRDDD